MAKSLVIVESPNKVKSIGKYLGSDYIVTSSVGHIRDLTTDSSFANLIPTKRGVKSTPDEKYNRAVLKMGINPFTWEGDFQIIPDKKKVIKDLETLAKSVDTIYLATDLDREGEAIA